MSTSPIPTLSAVSEAICHAYPAWQPSPELQALTKPLADAQLFMVAARAKGLLGLQLRTSKYRGDAAAQIRNCTHIMRLPFLRISKAVRTNRVNEPFVSAARAFNRELFKAKEAASLRLGEMANDPNIEPKLQERADLANASGSLLKIEYGEYNDVEIPEHLLPPTKASLAKAAAHQAKQPRESEENQRMLEEAGDAIMAMNPENMLAMLQEQAKHDPNLTPEKMAIYTAGLEDVKRSQLHVTQTRAQRAS